MSDAPKIFRSAVAAVDPARCVAEFVQIDGSGLVVDRHRFGLSDRSRIWVVGGGKAGQAMARGLAQAVDSRWPISGLINVPEASADSVGQIVCLAARRDGVNEPTAAAVAGTRQMREMIAHAAPADLVVALISGGGSALLCDPRPPVTLADKIIVTRHLAAAGVDIEQLNVVRRAISNVKAGGLVAGCRATVVTLVLSDVLGDPVESIASGPTVPPLRGWDELRRQAAAVLAQTDPHRQLPAAIYEVLNQRPAVADEGVPGGPVVIVGNNAAAVDAAGIAAESLGYNHVMHCPTGPQPTAERAGVDHAEQLLGLLRRDRSMHRVDALITGGEPTVRLCDESIRGLGGRNQQLVLAAYQRLLLENLSDADWDRITLLSAGTDGEDGPTDAAGAMIDAAVHRRAVAAGLDVADSLRRNDAYRFFDTCDGLIRTGPTGTNVCDIRVGLARGGAAAVT